LKLKPIDNYGKPFFEVIPKEKKAPLNCHGLVGDGFTTFNFVANSLEQNNEVDN